ncbi:MAG: hypothetical protein Q8M96_07165, partial [Rubrivivax sp.]|nr:hypothetical protein [Rubrivivax sp.]
TGPFRALPDMLKTLNWKHTPWQGPLAWLLAGGLALLLVSLAIQRLADRHLAADAERLAVGWGQQLGRRTSASASLRYTVFNSTTSPYREAAISASLSHRF